MKPNHLILTLALTASLTLQAQDITAPLSWTSSDGRVMQAKFIKLDGEAVVIKRGTQEFTVPFAKLAPESVLQAKRAALASRPARTPIAPAAAAKAGDPHLLPEADVIGDGWLAEGAKANSGMLLALHCDDLGDLILPVGVQTPGGDQRGLVKLSGYDGSLVWSAAPQDMAEGKWGNPIVVKDAAGNLIVGLKIAVEGKGHDVGIAKIEQGTGKVLWKWRYDGTQHGDDALASVAVDPDGNAIIAINAGDVPVREQGDFVAFPTPASLDSVVVKLDTKTGQPMWEARDHSVAGAKDTGLLSATQPAGVVLMRHDKDKAPNQLTGLDPATGKVLWQVDGGGRDRYKLTAQVTAKGILHSDGKHWLLTGLDGKNVWSVPLLFNERETVMALGETSAWINWLLQDIKGDTVSYTSTVGLLQLKDGTAPVKKEPLAGPADLANPAPPNQLEYPYYAGVQDKSDDLIFLGCAPAADQPYKFKPKLTRVSSKDGSVLWSKSIDTVSSKNPGYAPFFRTTPDGNVVYLWQEAGQVEVEAKPGFRRSASVFSLAKFSPTSGEMIWHQRIFGTLGGTVSATNWQLDAEGNIFVVFSAPGKFDAGPTGTDASKVSMTAMKVSGKDGAVQWLRGFPLKKK